MKFINKRIVKLLTLCILSLVFLVLAVLIFKGHEFKIDNYILSKLALIRSDFLTRLMIVISWMGDAIALISISIFSLIMIKNKNIPLTIILNLVFIAGFNQLLKLLFLRIRPLSYMIVEETGYSFPSGHSAVSLAFYGLIIYFINKSNLANNKKRIISVILSLLILFIGISRIYLGVHYVTDVIGGFLISLIYLTCLIYLIKKCKIKLFDYNK